MLFMDKGKGDLDIMIAIIDEKLVLVEHRSGIIFNHRV